MIFGSRLAQATWPPRLQTQADANGARVLELELHRCRSVSLRTLPGPFVFLHELIYCNSEQYRERHGTAGTDRPTK